MNTDLILVSRRVLASRILYPGEWMCSTQVTLSLDLGQDLSGEKKRKGMKSEDILLFYEIYEKKFVPASSMAHVKGQEKFTAVGGLGVFF